MAVLSLVLIGDAFAITLVRGIREADTEQLKSWHITHKACNQQLGKIMKRSLMIKSCVVAVILGILLVLLAFPRRNSQPIPSFQFLSGRGPAIRLESHFGERWHDDTRFVYTFQADYNDVCADANSELLALGYVITKLPVQVPRYREYMRRNKAPIDLDKVLILDKTKFAVYSTPKGSKYSSPDRHTIHYRDGWVTVEIMQQRPPSGLQGKWRIFKAWLHSKK